jgi:hypothetical protein
MNTINTDSNTMMAFAHKVVQRVLRPLQNPAPDKTEVQAVPHFLVLEHPVEMEEVEVSPASDPGHAGVTILEETGVFVTRDG